MLACNYQGQTSSYRKTRAVRVFWLANHLTKAFRERERERKKKSASLLSAGGGKSELIKVYINWSIRTNLLKAVVIEATKADMLLCKVSPRWAKINGKVTMP